MNQNSIQASLAGNSKLFRYVYLISVFFLTLTGFGQMPIFKRYYIADIPGLGWLADFYATYFIHYLAAALLLGVMAYGIFDYFLIARKTLKITVAGYLRGLILAVLVVTGILLAMKNFAGYRFPPFFITYLDLTHLIFVMCLLITGLVCIIFKKRWTEAVI